MNSVTMTDKKSVLVTGGAGYLGSVFVGHLLRRKHQVTVVDMLVYDHTSLFQYCNEGNFNFLRADARDEKVMAHLLKTHQVVFPLAALVGVKACERDQIGARTVNLEAIQLLKWLAKDHHQIIFPCTNSGYGSKSVQTICTEDTPMEPISLYGETKVSAEREIMSRKNSISLRLATVFGPSPRMRIDLLVNDFVYRAVTDGSLILFERDFKRNFVHIEDVADCFLFCLDHFDDMKGEVYNLGLDNANMSKSELAMKIKEHVPGLSIQYAEIDSDPDKRNYIVSSDKLKRKGFEAKRSLSIGIEQLIKAYRMVPRSKLRNE